MKRTLALTELPAKALGLTLAALILIAGLLASAPVNAAGGDDSWSAGKEGNPDFVAGEAAIKAQDYAKAIAHMNKVVAKEPRNADALNYLGYSHRKLGDFEASKAFYGNALGSGPIKGIPFSGEA